MLDLAENNNIPVGVELTGWTLQQIAVLDKAWLDRFRRMLEKKQCELIGSGWAQIIGPLVPYEVNRWNQSLGMEGYYRELGIKPRIALVNEMAYSNGMVEVYSEADYKGIIMDRDNVRLAIGMYNTPLSSTPTHAEGLTGRSLPVLWSDSILFQRLQRVVHGDIPISEYIDYVRQRMERDNLVLPVYCNDTEIFDYRPGRFVAESPLYKEGEWKRFEKVCRLLKERLNLNWVKPGDVLDTINLKSDHKVARLSSISNPVPVKKQAKYNINRWAVTGRDNLWLNTMCHRIYQSLIKGNIEEGIAWKELCEFWSSDLRTHITNERWDNTRAELSEIFRQLGIEQPEDEISQPVTTSFIQSDPVMNTKNYTVERDEEEIYWTIKMPCVRFILNARRGLTLKSLAFKSHNFVPVIGTLAQGYFDSIELGADFYSGGVIIEIPGERMRITDLEWVKPKILQRDSELIISTVIPIPNGSFEKTITVDCKSEKLKLRYDFHHWERPLGIVRVGLITLLPEAFSFPLSVNCINGGQEPEVFLVDANVDHGKAVSSLVSSTTAFGATDGRLVIGDSAHDVELKWNPSTCAASAMLQHINIEQKKLVRIFFSLCELDDTSKAGGSLLPFEFEISPNT